MQKATILLGDAETTMSMDTPREISDDVSHTARNLRVLQDEFLQKYPFNARPHMIDALGSIDIYASTKEDSFLLWVEYRLRVLGKATHDDRPLIQAKENAGLFKGLLKGVVDSSKSLADKLDAPWSLMKGWGGDMMLAKKIIYLYNSSIAFPIYSTEDMIHFLQKFDVDYEQECIRRYKCRFGAPIMSSGKRYELLTELLLREKVKICNWDNLTFGVFLYSNEEYKPDRYRQQGRNALLST